MQRNVMWLATSVALSVSIAGSAHSDLPRRAVPAARPTPAPASPVAPAPAAAAVPGVAPAPVAAVPAAPTPPLSPTAPTATYFGAPTHSPDQLDFGAVWNGQSSKRTLHLTTNAAGYVTVELPPGPFRVTEFREMGAVVGPSKNSGQSSTGMALGPVQQVKTRIAYPGGQGPWQWSLAPAAEIQIDVLFEPKFDLAQMNAGPKAMKMKVTGPGPHGNWALNVPLNGVFNGLSLSPIFLVPQSEYVVPVRGAESFDLPVRLVGTGDAASGQIVWPSLGAGLTAKNFTNVHLGPSELKDLRVHVDASGGHSEKTPLEGTVAFEYRRANDPAPKQTLPVHFKVTFIPDMVSVPLAEKTCNGVRITNPGLNLGADGRITLSVFYVGGTNGSEIRFEVFLPEAGRTFLHTKGQEILYMTPNGPAENPPSYTDHFDPGPPGVLDVYRALSHSTAELRCW